MSPSPQGGGFCGSRTKTLNLDLSAYDGLQFRVKGDGQIFKFNIKTVRENVGVCAVLRATVLPGQSRCRLCGGSLGTLRVTSGKRILKLCWLRFFSGIFHKGLFPQRVIGSPNNSGTGSTVLYLHSLPLPLGANKRCLGQWAVIPSWDEPGRLPTQALWGCSRARHRAQ